MSLIDKLPINVTGYACVKCGKWHKKGSKVFDAHYSSSFDGKNNRQEVNPKPL